MPLLQCNQDDFVAGATVLCYTNPEKVTGSMLSVFDGDGVNGNECTRFTRYHVINNMKNGFAVDQKDFDRSHRTANSDSSDRTTTSDLSNMSGSIDPDYKPKALIRRKYD